MTETRDFDRLARAWLDIMPDEAPDRVIATVLQAVDRTAQRRPSIDAAIRRFFEMNRLTYAAVALAIVVLSGGVLALTLIKGQSVGPSQSPSAVPSPSAGSSPASDALIPIQTGLLGNWLGAHRDVRNLGPAAGTHMVVSANAVRITQSNQQGVPLFSITGGMTADGKLEVAGPGAPGAAGCATDAAGTYAASVSPSGETLTIAVVADTCANRSNAIAGTWWLDNCKSGPCYGDIDPGTYGTEYFLPGMHSKTDWVPKYGALQFTTTGAWSVAADAPTHVILVPTTQFDKWTADGGPEGDPLDIFLFGQPGVIRNPASCPDAPEVDEAKGHTVPELLTYLRSIPGLSVTSVGETTIGGRTGAVVDLRLTSSSKVSCWGSGPSEEFLVTPFGQDFSWYTIGLEGTERTRLILLDVGPGSVVGIAIEASAANWDAMLHDATPIVESFKFE